MSVKEYKLVKKIIIKGQIKAETGLAIGGSNTAMGIGGVDKSIVRNTVNGEPYIPGSSLKGKLRSLFELSIGELGDKAMGAVKNGPCERDGSRSANLFGNASGSDKQRPSRIVVRDANLSKTQQKVDGTEMTKELFFKGTDLLFSEVKTEVVIDRITSKAMPRQMERVPAGAMFDFELVLNVFENESENQLIKDLFTSMQLVQNDYIGGSGSRGSGQIRFIIDNVKERDIKFYEFKSEEKSLTSEYSKYFPK